MLPRWLPSSEKPWTECPVVISFCNRAAGTQLDLMGFWAEQSFQASVPCWSGSHRDHGGKTIPEARGLHSTSAQCFKPWNSMLNLELTRKPVQQAMNLSRMSFEIYSEWHHGIHLVNYNFHSARGR